MGLVGVCEVVVYVTHLVMYREQTVCVCVPTHLYSDVITGHVHRMRCTVTVNLDKNLCYLYFFLKENLYLLFSFFTSHEFLVLLSYFLSFLSS